MKDLQKTELLKEFSEESILEHIKINNGLNTNIYDLTLKIYNNGDFCKDTIVKKYPDSTSVNKKCLSKMGRSFLKESKSENADFFIGFDRKSFSVEYYYYKDKQDFIYKSIEETKEGLGYYKYKREDSSGFKKYICDENFQEQETASTLLLFSKRENVGFLQKELKNRKIDILKLKEIEDFLVYAYACSVSKNKINIYIDLESYYINKYEIGSSFNEDPF